MQVQVANLPGGFWSCSRYPKALMLGDHMPTRLPCRAALMIRVVPEARGRAAQVLQSAEAYREQTVAEATGQTSRFLQILDQYQKAPDVTRERMYLETMERVLGGTDKIILDAGGPGGSAVVPYLPLNELTRPHPP